MARKLEAGNECPFSWAEQAEGCGPFKQNVWKPYPCRGDPCQLWTGSDCVFNAIGNRLASIEREVGDRGGG